jgi:pimeloyl-ACP methyl ester carboxylesterase
VTFIHGIANKPPADDLLRIFREAVARGAEPLPLGDLGVSSSSVYWADLLYEQPDDNLSAYEGTAENTAAAMDGGGDAPAPVARTAEERAFIGALRERLMGFSDAELETTGPPAAPDQPKGALERIPLPWFIKKRILNAYLRDVHHYLFDVEFAPPGRPATHIQQTIRRRFADALSARMVTRPHVIIAHSMGTVIAYDCLKRVADCVPVDGLITLGSPLGLDEVQDKLQPGWSRSDGFPQEKVGRAWANLFDRLDPVCGFDPILANDYRKGGTTTVVDVAVKNDGTWRHSATKYRRPPSFCSALRRMLDY